MKILKHGEVYRFTCKDCECEWVANKSECEAEGRMDSGLYQGTSYYCRCPDCGARTIGYEVEPEV